ncbi:hypothetical protein BDV11DRAFT_192877 [Aspergillus similis]
MREKVHGYSTDRYVRRAYNETFHEGLGALSKVLGSWSDNPCHGPSLHMSVVGRREDDNGSITITITMMTQTDTVYCSYAGDYFYGYKRGRIKSIPASRTRFLRDG